jgi:hypothetical protein
VVGVGQLEDLDPIINSVDYLLFGQEDSDNVGVGDSGQGFRRSTTVVVRAS